MFSKRSISRIASATALAALVATPMFAASIKTDYDHDANFRAYHTFSFYKVQSADPLYEQRIKDEITADLTKAGWQMVPTGGDVTISAIGGVHTKQEYDTFYDGLGGGGWGWRRWGGWGGGWGDEQTTVTQVPVGTLMIDMFDSSTHQLIWRGSSQDDISNNSGKNTKKLDKDIDHMLNGFPPKTRG